MRKRDIILAWVYVSAYLLGGVVGTGTTLWMAYDSTKFMATAVHAKGRVAFQRGRGEVVAFESQQGAVNVPLVQVTEPREQLGQNAELDLVYPPENPQAARRLSREQRKQTLWPIGAILGITMMVMAVYGMRQVRRKTSQATGNTAP